MLFMTYVVPNIPYNKNKKELRLRILVENKRRQFPCLSDNPLSLSFSTSLSLSFSLSMSFTHSFFSLFHSLWSLSLSLSLAVSLSFSLCLSLSSWISLSISLISFFRDSPYLLFFMNSYLKFLSSLFLNTRFFLPLII